jgi:DNA-binding NtrC family response regulator
MHADQAIKVLLVDDEEAFGAALARRLERRGLDLRTAAGGSRALEILASESVDVVVLDVKMPAMDGLEVLARIKAAHPLIEVILLSGHADLETSLSGLERGAFDYLLKPVPFDELFDKIHDAWQKRKVALGRHGAEREDASANSR